ncbi:ENOS interacting protein [Xylariomycetidae sp. FL2044]|nr:ENOS interacting protein [Xylariomycetidae sp. FL2044]
MSHSKRNTSRAVFTSHERDLAKKAWTSTSARLTRESFLPFSSCGLCLQIAVDPVACTHGDIFCRECCLSNILAQKKEIKRLEKVREHEERESSQWTAAQDAEARERAVREFELTQSGLDIKPKTTSAMAKARDLESWRSEGKTASSSPAPTADATNTKRPPKRKFEMSEAELELQEAQVRAKARKAIDDEKASKPILPSFWVPSITPSSNTHDTLHDIARKTKGAPVCPASHQHSPHTYSLHSLVTVNFTEEDEDEKSSRKKRIRVCPSCRKGLNNSSKAMLAKPCGHVVCKSCVDKFMRPAKHHDPHAPASSSDELRCYVCEADLAETSTRQRDGETGTRSKKKDKEKIKPGLVELKTEGTGFSAAGQNQVEKSGVAFQC